MQTPNKQWQYTKPAENMAIAATSVASLALLGVTAVTLFTPVAYIAAAGYAMAHPVIIHAATHILKKKFNKLARKKLLTSLQKDHPFAQRVEEISQKMGREKAPEIQVYENLPSTTATKYLYGAIPEADILTVARPALDNPMPDEERKFIIAHEMAHLKTDGFNVTEYTKHILRGSKQALFLGAAWTFGAGLAGIALPISAVAAPLWVPFTAALGACYAASVIHAVGSRKIEKRADRNALYTTDFNMAAATNVIDRLHSGKKQLKTRLISSHPGYLERHHALIDAGRLKDQFSQAAIKQAAPATQPVPANNNEKTATKQKRLG